MSRTSSLFVVGVLLVAGASGCAPSPTREVATAASSPTPAPERGGGTGKYAKPSTAELRSRLTPVEFEVTQNAATEPPFRNAYWDNHADGIYLDVVSGEPLFSSRDKFDSGTGWPSFTRPLWETSVTTRRDEKLGMERVEVLSRSAGSHLGHVFEDGPAPTHKRYCMNSAALRFVPAERLQAEGYGDYTSLFATAAASSPLPAATANACAFPAPGQKAGCSATLSIAVFAGEGTASRRPRLEGVLDVVAGRAGEDPAVEVTFDPARISYADVAREWSPGRPKDAATFQRN